MATHLNISNNTKLYTLIKWIDTFKKCVDIAQWHNDMDYKIQQESKKNYIRLFQNYTNRLYSDWM